MKHVKPAVVSITSKIEEPEEGLAGQNINPFGQQLPIPLPFPFGNQQQRHHTMEARGSGFVIDADGTVVTNNHVVKNAKSVTVTLDDGTTLPAKILGRDTRTDIAVLKVKADHKLPFISLGDSDAAQPGSWVIAVGNPFGLGGTVTAGIVSARGRDIGDGPYDSFIQIDAPINQGNSGGPLFTQDGKVVGVNTAILSPSGGSVGIGFAIPSNTVKNVVLQLEKSGRVTRGFIGVQAQSVTAAMAGALRLPASNSDDRGALVASVEPDSPALHAGVQPGDVITSVNGHQVVNPRELAITISQIPPGGDAVLAVYRNGTAKSIDVTVGTLQGDQASGRVGNSAQGSPSLGVGLQGADGQSAPAAEHTGRRARRGDFRGAARIGRGTGGAAGGRCDRGCGRAGDHQPGRGHARDPRCAEEQPGGGAADYSRRAAGVRCRDAVAERSG